MKHSIVLVFGVLLSMGCAAQETSVAVPEAGFVSSEKYTNAFFGFSLPLPQDSALRGFAPPSKFHSLFGLQAGGGSCAPPCQRAPRARAKRS